MKGADAAVALITGGTGGIGRAIGEALQGAGYRVVLAAPADAGPKDCGVSDFAIRPLDVTDPHSIAEALADIDELSVLVNAAGITLREGREFDPNAFARVVDINLTGAMRMCMAAHPLLTAAAARRGGAAIVNICSMLSFFGSPTVPAYAASKGGLLLLTKSLAGAWAADGIRVNAVAPGYIETDLTRPLFTAPDERNRIESRTPMRRWGQPAEIAGTVAFLCSAAAGFMTGAVLVADGGYSAV